MAKNTITPLGYALLGLIRDEPRSGYALRKVFETTPLGNYSSSPGSIYPALAGLERGGLVETRGAGRGKGLFHLTAKGVDVFDAWLRQPVLAGDDLSVAMLRFAFLNGHPDRSLTYTFLDSFAVAATAQVEALTQFLATDLGRTMPLQSRVAVEHGRRNFDSSAQWALWAKQVFDKGELVT